MEIDRNVPLKEKIRRLLVLNSTPPEIALGVAIGVFICTLPVYGFHTVLVVVFAFLVRRANKIAMLVGTNFSLPPTLPFITWAGYETGRRILPGDYPPLTFDAFRPFDLHRIGALYLPLFVGSVVFGLVCAAGFYFLTLAVVRRHQKKRGV